MNDSNTYTFPEDFIKRMKLQMGSQSDLFFKSLESEPATSIRINQIKFKKNIEGLEQVPWCSSGIFLKERPIFTLDPLLHAGAYYVQEASSMFLEQAFKTIDISKEKLVLDLCGAPGGKSTHLLSLLNDNDLLVSNEVIQSRAKILQENIRKWGSPNVVITNNDPKDFQRLNGFFDIIAVDAPCSGEGLFKRDRAARDEWSTENAHLCSVRQGRILADIWSSLKTGGYLIYSTCTFNPEENEENMKWLLTQKNFSSIRIPIAPEWGIDEFENEGIWGYHFFPHKIKSEGFFMTILQKTDSEPEFKFPRKGKKNPVKIPANMNSINNWIRADDYDMQLIGDKAVAYPKYWQNELTALTDNCKVLNFGLPFAEIKGKDIAPTHELATSTIFNASAFENNELEIEEALKYLHKEEVKMISGKTGWQTVSFQNTPLGFIKNLGSRANNYYPKEWRIRMQVNRPEKLWHQA